MAEIGRIVQYIPAKMTNMSIPIGSPCIFGVSIGERDYLKTNSDEENFNFCFNINYLDGDSETIFIGKTRMFNFEYPVKTIDSIVFSNCPNSVTVNVIYI